MLNDAIPPRARESLGLQGGKSVTLLGGENALVNIDGLKSAARDSISDVVNGVMRVVNKALPAAIAATASLQYRGTQGSFLSYLSTNYINLRAKFFQIAGDNSDLIGYPTHAANSLLSNYSGFVLCENAVIAIGGTVIEEQAIEDLLNAGVFIE